MKWNYLLFLHFLQKFKNGIAYQYMGLSQGSFVVNGLNCLGNESNIDECPVLPVSRICSKDAGVLCFDDKPPIISLIGGLTENTGTIQITFRNKTATICDKLWGNINAKVLCRSLNKKYTDGKAYM